MSDPGDQMRGVLKLTSSSGKPYTVKLKRPNTIIGREKADVIINDIQVSSSHCQIQEIDGEHLLFDMNSTNGTYLNEKKILKATISSGDIIRIGRSKIYFSLINAYEASSVPFFNKHMQDQQPKSVVETLFSPQRTSSGRVLKVTYPDAKSELLRLNKKEVIFGSSSAFGRFDVDAKIAEKHLLVLIDKLGDVYIKDLGSKYGTYVNGKKILSMRKISRKDKIIIGTTTLHLVNTK